MLFLAGAELGGVDGRALDDLLGRRELIVAFGEGDLRGLAAAAMLFADYSVLRRGASVVIDTPAGWAGLAWRLGAGAYRWYLRGGWVSVIGCRLSVLSREPRSSVRRSTDDRQPTTDNPIPEKMVEELVDEVTDQDSDAWLGNWTRNRSVLALDSAAVLIRSRGGDRLERAEFARLFATGEPQHGLGAFLAKKSPRYS